MGSVFFEITVIICLAAFLSIIFKALKQPTVLAYILTGIVIGPLTHLQLGSRDFLQTLSELGITLLLFVLGLEIKLKEFHLVGKTIIVVGVLQILLTAVYSYFIGLLFNFTQAQSFYISVALTFSSTIIVVKILSDKKDLKSLYGKISIGLLLVQDFFAIFILVILSGFKNPNFFEISNLSLFLAIILKALILFSIVIFLSKTILPRFLNIIAKSRESLFIFSLAWVFGVSAFISSPFIGFSIEIGGFLAGIALAEAFENFQIIARMRALRDFFIVIFFVSLGMGMTFINFNEILFAIVVFSIIVLFIKPLVIVAIMGILGYKRRTSFLTGLNLTQISEFSLVIVFLGAKLGHIPDSIVTMTTGVAIFTFMLSTYLIHHSNIIYKILSKHLLLFEKKENEEDKMIQKDDGVMDLKEHVVLIGAHRMGEAILDALKDLGKKVIVVDFDPSVIKELRKDGAGVISIFGDIADLEIQERAAIDRAKLVISTAPDLEDNLTLVENLNKINKHSKVIVMARDGEDAGDLYNAGADYVVVPHLFGGRQVARILKEDKLSEIEEWKRKDREYLS